MKRLLLALMLCTLLAANAPVSALTANQRRVIQSGVYYFNTEDTCPAPMSVAIGSSAETGGGTNIQKISPAPFTGNPMTPTGIVLHWTGGSPNESVESFIAGMNSKSLSVQLFIDGAGKVYQLVDQLGTETAHATNANPKTIGIEIAAGSDGTVATSDKEINANAVQKQAVVNTVLYLIQTFNMQIDPDVASFKGILSHHLVSPGDKSDVGDQYHQSIITAVKNGGQVVVSNTGSCLATGGSSGGGDANANKQLGQRLAEERGFAGAEWACLLELWTRESGWRTDADNPGSSAYGIPQALVALHKKNIDQNYAGYYGQEIQKTPGSPATYDYTGGSAEPQIKWGLDYITGRYRTPCTALSFHDANNYY